MWTNIVLLFTHVLTETRFNAALQVYVLGIPLVVTLIITRKDPRYRLLLLYDSQIYRPEQFQQRNFLYLRIICKKEKDRTSEIFLKGYISHHSVVCPYDACPIKNYKKMLEKQLDPVYKARHKGQSSSSQNQGGYQLLLAQGKAIYINSIRKFPKSHALRLDYATFLQSKMKNRRDALQEIQNAYKIGPSFDQQFMLFRLQKLIEQELQESEHGGVDYLTSHTIKTQFNDFKHLIDKTSMLHLEFWNHLLDEQPDLVRLSQQGAKINKSLHLLEEQFKILSKISSIAPKVLRLYASFIVEIKNDKEGGAKEMLRAKDAAALRGNVEYNNMNEDFSDVNSYASDGTPCVYMSGEQESIGTITQVNMAICKVFGYTRKEELLGKPVEHIQPRVYSEHHKYLLSASIAKNQEQLSARERQVFGKSSTGYIFPVWLQLKNLPSLLSGKQYVATFKIEKSGINKTVSHLLLNPQKEIVDISTSCIQMLKINYDLLYKKNIWFDVHSLLPDLFEQNARTQYENRTGSPIEYHYPKIQAIKKEIIQEEVNEIEDNKSGDDEDEDYYQNTNPTQHADLNAQSLNKQTQPFIPDMNPTEQEKRKLVDFFDNPELHNPVEENDNIVKFTHEAISSGKTQQFHAILTPINLELIGVLAGYHLLLKYDNENMVEEKNYQGKDHRSFQFAFNPLLKRYIRELRDQENKEAYEVDGNLALLQRFKQLGENQEQDQMNEDEQKLHEKYKDVTYVQFIQKQQKKMKNNQDLMDFMHDSEDDDSISNDSHDEQSSLKEKKPTKKGESKEVKNIQPILKDDIFKALPGQIKDQANNNSHTSMIKKLDQNLKDRQSIAKDVKVWRRIEGAVNKWEEVKESRAGIFSQDISEISTTMDDDAETSPDQEEDKDSASFKAHIRSKKAFQMAINDKTMPSSIKRLQRSAFLIMAILIAVAITEMVVVREQLTQMQSNFDMISLSYYRQSQVQKVVSNVRSLLLVNQDMLTNYNVYESRGEYLDHLFEELDSSLNEIYQIQNTMNAASVTLSEEHDLLLNSASVTLYFKEENTNTKSLKFSLTEAILQISSTIFTLKNMEIGQFRENNEDIFFMMFNSLNDFYEALLQSSDLFVFELEDIASQKTELIMALFISACIALVLAFIFLYPVVRSVNSTKDQVLNLFCTIDNSAIRIFVLKCERFIQSMSAEDGNEDIESNEDIDGNLILEDEDYALLSREGRQQKQSKGQSKTGFKFFFKTFVMLLVISSYYLANFLQFVDQKTLSQELSAELNGVASIQSYYWLIFNAEREAIYDKQTRILNSNAFDITVDFIEQAYIQDQNLMAEHLAREPYLDQTYLDRFEQLMRNSICFTNPDFILSQEECDEFASGILNEGLHTTFVSYYNTLRQIIGRYNQQRVNKGSPLSDKERAEFYNGKRMESAYIIMNRYLDPLIYELQTLLTSTVTEQLQNSIETRTGIFFMFFVVLVIAFVFVWIPFLNSLNNDIYKTKLLLLIIPHRILIDMKNIEKVIQSQTFTGVQKKTPPQSVVAQNAEQREKKEEEENNSD